MQSGRLKRREFFTLLGAAAAWPLAGRAQSIERLRRIGYFTGLAESDPESRKRMAVFREALAALGWSEGRNIVIDARFLAGRSDQIQQFAKELVEKRPDLIFATSGPTAMAVKRESDAIPIIFVGSSDPIGAGLVASLARPGGNATGFLLYEASITGKWLAMLKEIAPGLRRAALVGNPKTVPFDYYLRAAEVLAQPLGIEVVASRIASAADIERALDDFAILPNGGFVFPADSTTNVHRDLIITRLARYRLPAIYSGRFMVSAGGLISYDIDRADTDRKAASYVDRILRGANPADLPVQTPTKFETVINLRTAKALGITVPPSLLIAADELVE